MPDLTIFIPTRNRPLQLDACIKSTIKAVGFNNISIKFVFLERNDESYQKDFNLCLGENFNNTCYSLEVVKENDFRNNLIDILEETYSYCTLCMTDDTVFWRDNVNFNNIFEFLRNNQHVLTYSLRVGENCKIQDPLTKSKSLDFHEYHEGVEFFNHEQFYEFNCNDKPLTSNLFYQISMDGHIYRSKELLKMCKETPFKNLREWESNLVQNSRRKDWMFIDKNYLSSGITSATVNLIYNQQLPPYSNNVSKFYYPAEELNNYFRQGKRIDISKTLRGVPEGSHVFRELVLY